jgi:peptidoglycan/xylan/chitin deacetylase (PgdA/CDA1 family)
VAFAAAGPVVGQDVRSANAATVAPAPPFGLTLVERTSTSARLEWTPGPGNTHGFKIRASAQAGVHPDPVVFPGGKLAAFTFTTDDGLMDNLVYEPIFTTRGLKFTAFVNPVLAGNGNRMPWGDIEFLFQQGHEVYNHTDTHTALIDDRALSLRYLGAEPCTLKVRADTLETIIQGVGTDLKIVLSNPLVQYLIDLVAVLDADPDYDATLLYADTRQFATQSIHLDPKNPGVQIGQGAPADTLTTARGVHDDAELRTEVQAAETMLEAHLRIFEPSYECRFLAYPNHAHRQRAMSILNELGYTTVRSGAIGSRPFFSEAAYVPGYTSSYEVPLTFPLPNNSWDEPTTRAKYQQRVATWKANHEWAVLLSHGEAEADSLHVEWMLDEIAADPDVWVAPFGEVADYIAGFFTDVGAPVDSVTGKATGWIHGLSPSETTWVVVTAYSDSLQESAWSNEIAVPPPAPTAVPGAPAARPGAATRAFPNPSSAGTTIAFEAPREGRFFLEIFDIRGARIDGRDLGVLQPGRVHVDWSPPSGRRPLSSGVYVYRVREQGPAGVVLAAGKLALIR